MAKATDIRDLLGRFALISDPREDRGLRHSLVDVLFIVMVAMVSRRRASLPLGTA